MSFRGTDRAPIMKFTATRAPIPPFGELMFPGRRKRSDGISDNVSLIRNCHVRDIIRRDPERETFLRRKAKERKVRGVLQSGALPRWEYHLLERTGINPRGKGFKLVSSGINSCVSFVARARMEKVHPLARASGMIEHMLLSIDRASSSGEANGNQTEEN